MSDAVLDRETIDPDQLVNRRLVALFFLMALVFLSVAILGGLLMALQLVHWNPLRGIELLSPGRWRMIHTNAVAYGFLANAFLGALEWSVPRMTLRPVASRALSWFIFVAWQVIVLSTAVGIMFGQAQGVEWGETPVWIDPVAMLGLILVMINFMVPIARRRRVRSTWHSGTSSRLSFGRRSPTRWATSCRSTGCRAPAVAR
ncbi:MAG: cbb3-type cytochrome c oxidase subunit I [Pirellulales bacterium]